MNRHLVLLALCQGLFLVNGVTFIAINGLVGLDLAPRPWMATLPIMSYVVGGAIAAPIVARSQTRWGRRASFQLGLAVAFFSALLAAYALHIHSFVLLITATAIAGYYYANGQLYRFAAAELATPDWRNKAVSLVLAGSLIGAVIGPNMADWTRGLTATPFVGAYIALAVVALVAMGLMAAIRFPADPSVGRHAARAGRPMGVLFRQPAFLVAVLGAAVSYGVMNLLMAATPLAMQVYGFQFGAIALVLQWHVIGMYAPGFATGWLIDRWGNRAVMAIGVALLALCVAIALAGVDLHHFLVALVLLGIGWNFLFTGATALALTAYRPEERDRAQGAINVCMFLTMAVTSFTSGAVVTTSGWAWLNAGSAPALALMIAALAWLTLRARPVRA